MAGAGRAGRGAVAPGGGRSGNVASAENDPVPLVESGGAGVDRDQPLIPHARTRRPQIRPNASGNRWPCAADVSEYSGTFPATGEGIVAVRHYARAVAVAVAVAVARRAGSSWSGGEDGELAHSYGLMIIEGLPTGGAATWRKTPMVAGPLSSNVREAVGGIKDEPVADQTPRLSVTRRPGVTPSWTVPVTQPCRTPTSRLDNARRAFRWARERTPPGRGGVGCRARKRSRWGSTSGVSGQRRGASAG